MSRRNDRTYTGGLTLKHLFLGTALMGMVFGTGVIVGQRLLLEEGLPPLISVGEASPIPPQRPGEAQEPGREGPPGPSIFSFFEVLTNAEGPDPSLPEMPSSPARQRPNDGSRPERGQEVEPPEQPSNDEASAPQQDARYTLQVGSHPTIERARAELDRLRTLSLEPHIVATEVAGQGQFYRVRIGKYATLEEAQLSQRKLRAEQEVQTFVTPL